MLFLFYKATSYLSFIETKQATEGKDKERDKTENKSNRWRKEKEQRKEILNK